MARALSGVKYCRLAAARLSGDGIVMGKRGFSVPVAAVGKSLEEKKKKQNKREAISPLGISWVPDPVTGYYRPVNLKGDADAAEMRDLLCQSSQQS